MSSLAPNPASVSEPVSAPAPAARTEPQRTPPRLPRWLERGELFLRVLLRMYIGLALVYLPWSRTFWDMNPLFLHFPALSSFAASGAVRGVISGLGFLNLWIAFQDALRHWDE